MRLIPVLILLVGAVPAPVWAQAAPTAGTLTLERAEARSLASHPSLDELAARIRAAEARATAAGQLPDPRLSVGAANVPVDTFDLEQEPMTQLQVGLSQDFPAPGTLDLKAKREAQQGTAYRARLADTRAELVRRVRLAWLERFYVDRALDEVADNLDLFEELLAIARSQYRVGKGLQQAVLLAQLERDKLLDRRASLRRRRADADSRLGELLAVDWRPARSRRAFGRVAQGAVGPHGFELPDNLPELPEPPPPQRLADDLERHPRLRAVAAQIDRRGTAVALAEKDYYPDMGVDLAYGYRPGSAPNGEPWADFASVKFRMSLPLFTGKRQDKRLAAALDEKDALQRKLRRTRLALERRARSQWAALRAAHERADLYDDSILPESEQTVEASVAAYTTGRLDFLNLVRARIQDLEHQLTRWRLRVDAEQAKAELLYLAAGEGER